MNRFFQKLLLAAVFTALLCLHGFAADSSGIYDIMPLEDGFSISPISETAVSVQIGGENKTVYTELQLELRYAEAGDSCSYAVFVLESKNQSLSESSIVYMDQNNTGTFTISLQSLQAGSYSVFMSGTDMDYGEVVSFRYYAGLQAQNLIFPEGNIVDKTCGDENFTVTVTGAAPDSIVTYASSDESVASVDAATGEVTIKKAGTSVITATAGKTDAYAAATAQYTLTVKKAAQDTFSFLHSSVEKTYGDASFTLAAAGAIYGSTVTYASSDESIASVDAATGTVTIKRAGTAVISAAAGETDFCTAADAQYTLTVQPKPLRVKAVVLEDKIYDAGCSAKINNVQFDGLVFGEQLMPGRDYSGEARFMNAKAGASVAATANITLLSTQRAENYRLINGRDFATFGKIDRNIYFVDVPEGEYYTDAVAWALAKNVTKGTSETEFSPDQACTRAQAVTFLWRAAGYPKPTSDFNPFEDVTDPSQYYYQAVLWAVEKGITTGTTQTLFSPDETCTRAQIVTFLWRYAQKPQASASVTFSDIDSAAYYYRAVQWAVERKVTNGMGDNQFQPDTDCARGHIVTFLYRFWES